MCVCTFVYLTDGKQRPDTVDTELLFSQMIVQQLCTNTHTRLHLAHILLHMVKSGQFTAKCKGDRAAG